MKAVFVGISGKRAEMLPHAFIFSSNLFHTGFLSFKLITAWTK